MKFIFKNTRAKRFYLPESELLLELLESSLESELPDPEAAEDFVDFEDLFDTASTSGIVFTSFIPNWTVLKIYLKIFLTDFLQSNSPCSSLQNTAVCTTWFRLKRNHEIKFSK